MTAADHSSPDGTVETRRSAVFPHGFATGDVDTTSLVVWTRACPPPHVDPDAAGHVTWSLWSEDGGCVAEGTMAVGPEHDHTCRVTVDGLQPATTYHVVCEAFGDRTTGRTRTLPVSADRVRLAVACCSRWGWPGFERYGAIADEDPDVVLHLGDYVYEIGELAPSGRHTDPPHECRDLDDYRRRYAQHRADPALQRLHETVPFLSLWDDHEVVDNAPDDETAQRRIAGAGAWLEWMPVDHGAGSLDRVRRIGGLVDLVLLDARYGGRWPADTDGPSTERAAGPILADDQWNLLERAVAESTAPWFVVANQVQVAPMTLAYAPHLGWPPWRRVVNPDQWDGFPDDRARLTDLLARVRGRPVVLSGDLHAGWSRQLVDDGGATVAHEFTSPSISGASYAEAVRDRTGLPEWLVRAILLRLNPGIDHLDLGRHGYLSIDVTADRFTTTFVHHDGTTVTRTLDAGRA